MQSVFVRITKLIASEIYFCKEVFCNNFGRDGTVHLKIDIVNTRSLELLGARLWVVGVWNRHNVANLRSNLETVHMLAILRAFLGF